MEQAKKIADRVGSVLKAEVEFDNEKSLVKKTRDIEIPTEGQHVNFVLEMDISFKTAKEYLKSFNKGEIFLLPAEFTSFFTVLQNHEIPMPADCKYHLVENPDISCFYIESHESPVHFVKRLAAALCAIGCL